MRTDPLDVLHLYAGNLFGGIETLLATSARLRDLAPAMRPQFGLCFRGRLWDELAATGVVIHDLGAVRLSRPWSVRRARARLRAVLLAERPDWVATHDSWPHAVFGPAVRRAGIRLVHFVHGLATGRTLLERLASRTRPDLVIANSQFTARLASRMFSRTKVATWHYPVARTEVSAVARSEVRSEFGTSERAVVILQASRLERWKGHAVLIEALCRLRDIPDWEFWLAGGAQKPGEAAFLEELRSAAGRGGIAGRVRFLGQRADVTRLMAAADIFCQPNSGPEPFGIVLIEALYSGLPVVTSGFGGGAEIVDPTCGVLTNPGDPASVAAALASLITDGALRRTLGARGNDRARALCDPARQLDALSSLLETHDPSDRQAVPVGRDSWLANSIRLR